MEHLKKNPLEFTAGPFHNADGTLADFSGSDNFTFVIKANKTDEDSEALLIADKDSGITWDVPTAVVNGSIDADDMEDVIVGTWFMALQESPSGTEFILTENGVTINQITITQDIIRG